MSSVSAGLPARGRPRIKAPLDRLGTASSLVALAALLLIAFFMRFLTLNGLSLDAQDEGVYWQSLRLMSQGFPLFTSIFSSQPPFFLASIQPLYQLFGQSLAGARLAVALFSLLGIAFVYMLGTLYGNRLSGLVAALLLSADQLFFTASHSLQAECPAIVWEIIAVTCAAYAVSATAPRQFLLFTSGAALIAGTLTKLFDVVAIAPIAIYVVLSAACVYDRDDQFGSMAWKDRRRRLFSDIAFFAFGSLLTGAIVLAPYVHSRNDVWDQVVRFHQIAAQTFLNTGQAANIRLVISTISADYPLPYLALVVLAGAVMLVWRQWSILAPLAWLAGSLAFLVQQQPVLGHQFSLLAGPLAILAAIAVSPALSRLSWPRTALSLTGGILVALALSSMIPTTLATETKAATAVPRSMSAIALAIDGVTTPSELIATDDQYLAGLANRSVIPQLVDTSQVRIVTGYLEPHYMAAPWIEHLLQADHTHVIVSAGHRFALIGGFMTWVQAHYHAVATVGDGRTLWLMN